MLAPIKTGKVVLTTMNAEILTVTLDGKIAELTCPTTYTASLKVKPGYKKAI